MSTDSSKRVIKAGAGYVIGNYMLKGITFLSVPIFSRLLTTEDYGNFNTYLSYESIIYILLGLALHSSLNNAKYKYKEKLNEYISSIITLVTLSLVVWLLLSNIFYNEYQSMFGFTRTIVNILILHCFGSSLLQIYNSYISLNYSYKSFLRISATNALTNMILSIILILTFFTDDRCLGRIVGTAIPIIAIGIYIVIYFIRKAKPKIKKEYWSFGLKYSIPIVPHGISQVILSSFDRIMIRDMIGAAEAGIYSFAYTIYLLFKVAVTSLENVWKPWVYEQMEKKDYESIRKQGSNYAYGMALFTALIIIVSPEMIKILGSKAYWGSANCVIPVLLGGYFAFLYTLPAIIEYYYSKTKFIALGTMAAAVLNIILNYIYIPKYGYIAAAYTTLITYMFYFIFHYLLAKKIHGISLFSTLHMILISIGIITIGFITMVIEPLWYVRWAFEVVLGIYSIIWADKKFHFVYKLKQKLSRK